METDNATTVARKKIVRMGNSQGISIDKHWLTKQGLEIGNEVEVIQNNDFILINDCRNPFFRDMLAQKIEALEKLSRVYKMHMEDHKEDFERADKELDAPQAKNVAAVKRSELEKQDK